MTPVRVEVAGKVLRLFPSFHDAQVRAQLLAHGALERFQPVEHESGTGWLVSDKESGRQFDDAGPI